jgi:hypothetical protein
VSPSRKKPTENATQTTELELDEGYALGGVGECERQEVFPDIDSKLVISRPKKLLYWRRRKKTKATLPIVVSCLLRSTFPSLFKLLYRAGLRLTTLELWKNSRESSVGMEG